MKQHEREYFVSRIRSGIVPISNESHTVYVHAPNMLHSLEANRFAMKTYEKAEYEEVMDMDEMNEWMIEHELWSHEEDEQMKGIEKDIKTLREKIYLNRDNDNLREQIRLYLRAGETGYTKLSMKKNEYAPNTCEGLATSARYKFIIENCCTDVNGDPYDFVDMSVDFVSLQYQDSALAEKQLREIAREEPWKSTWSVYGKSENMLFHNKDRDLTQDQKGILIWSTMYDNIQEHFECPSDDVIKDDDVLDGWFIVQRNKREKEKLQGEVDGELTNDRIKNAHEVFMVPDGDKKLAKINDMNSGTAKMFKKQREKLIEHRGTVQQGELFDERLGIRSSQSDMYKNKFR
jgi:hypothetical protein